MKTKPTLLELFQHLEKLMNVCFCDAFLLLNTPEALNLGIKVLKHETYHVRQYAKKMEDEWEKQLPFNCNEEKGIDWFHWTRVFNWQRIRSFIISYMPEQDVDSSECPILEELKEEMEKLHYVLICINNIMTDSPAFRFKRYYERRKDAYMELYGSFELNEELEFHKEIYRRYMFDSEFMKVSIYADTTQEFQDKAERTWASMLDKDGCPNEICIGEYIFRYRNELVDDDLKYLFRYINVLERLKNPNSGNQQETILIEDLDGVFKTEFSRFPNSRKLVKVNLHSLHKIIKDHCLIYIEKELDWFCLWKVLKDFGLLRSNVAGEKFVTLMNNWYPDHHHPCSGNGIHDYRPSYLGKTKVSDWKYNEFIEEKNRNNRNKVIPKNFEPFKNACIKMKEALVPFCDHPNEGLD